MHFFNYIWKEYLTTQRHSSEIIKPHVLLSIGLNNSQSNYNCKYVYLGQTWNWNHSNDLLVFSWQHYYISCSIWPQPEYKWLIRSISFMSRSTKWNTNLYACLTYRQKIQKYCSCSSCNSDTNLKRIEISPRKEPSDQRPLLSFLNSARTAMNEDQCRL